MSRAKSSAIRAQCTNNLKQWGVAISMYAGENRDFFPDNSLGRDLSWMSPKMNEFYRRYLFPNQRGTTQKLRAQNDVLYCPTDEWHRIAETTVQTDDTAQLLGYFYLPGRTTGGWPYESCGLAEWHYRKKLGGRYRNAPIMSDRLQSDGTWNVAANTGSVRWTTDFLGRTIKLASHRDKGDIPTGGNFLFEDGHAEWYKFRLSNARASVDVGSMAYGWVLFYRPFNVSTNL